jgi:peptidoglycan/xylan/chitin deacetylase (PgdA/CDA1 family)
MLASILAWFTNMLRFTLYRFGMLALYHRIRNARTLTVLMFHRVLPSDSIEFQHAEQEFTFSTTGFAACLDFVQQNYQVVSLEQVIQSCNGGSPLPPCSALITFDDGWLDTITYACPQLAKRGLPAVLFLATEVLESESRRWWQDALVELFTDVQNARLLADELDLEDAGLHTLTAVLASMPDQQRIDLLAKYVDCSDCARQMVSRSDLVALDQRYLAIAAHGHSHSPLTKSFDLNGELERSREVVAGLCGNYEAMSFPHGAQNVDTFSAVKNAGFKWVFSSTPEINSFASIHAGKVLGRIHVPENRWTCSNGKISPARLASFLFFRSIA